MTDTADNSIHCLRQTIRCKRRQLGLGARQRAANKFAQAVVASKVYQQSRHIALYLANDGELDCRLLMKQAWRDGKQCYLPVLMTKESRPPMLFAAYVPGALLAKNRYGILEPKSAALLNPSALDLVIVPLVACDPKGNRIGMGGGYYDKSFAFINKAQLLKGRPRLLGGAYHFQKVNNIKPRSWDVSLDQTVFV